MPTIHLIGTRSGGEQVAATLQDLILNSRASLPVVVHARTEVCAGLSQVWPANDRLLYQAFDAGLPLAALLAGEGKQVWLAAGTRLPLGWDVRLLAMAAKTAGYGVVSALCTRLAAHKPARLSYAGTAAWPEPDRRVPDVSRGEVVSTRFISPYCCVVQAAVQVPGNDLDFGDAAQRLIYGVRLLAAGISLGLADATLVHWDGENGFPCEPGVAAFEQHLADYHALLPVQSMDAGLSPRPRRLLGGALETMVRVVHRVWRLGV
ncbi:hypothetical protein FNU76_13310 [Chitinimonas arctica]|uniref:Uncharacterized protein n=1 Tax=Chitinimonas arctica TaxID=2594795 RepID=A0A516SGK5_9NEIS|nr:hypothetical protein [Chitinimonas arctica]QDQ27262.1 hypothetical protein FNU76_13310 [Chitinimonas arctica]